MEQSLADLDDRIARRLKTLRAERGWSLDALARASGVSRASLSRIENAEVSATAAVLGRLASAYGLTMSRLLAGVEESFTPLVPVAYQPRYADPTVGFERRTVSPPSAALAGEAVVCRLRPGARIAYDETPRPGLEHHLLLLDGRLRVTVEGIVHDLAAGDCLRYRLHGPSVFETSPDAPASYVLFLV